MNDLSILFYKKTTQRVTVLFSFMKLINSYLIDLDHGCAVGCEDVDLDLVCLGGLYVADCKTEVVAADFLFADFYAVLIKNNVEILEKLGSDTDSLLGLSVCGHSNADGVCEVGIGGYSYLAYGLCAVKLKGKGLAALGDGIGHPCIVLFADLS